MTKAAPPAVTQLLRAWSEGDESALERLVPLVEGELRRLARGYMARERGAHTLQPTALVNEAYLRLIDARHVQWQDRAHFFAVAAQAMRRVLIDFARARQNLKRGGGALRVSLDEGLVAAPERGADLLALDEALAQLARLNPRQARVVELRYFGGLSEEEVGHVLEIAPRTVRLDWKLARAWLYKTMTKGAGV